MILINLLPAHLIPKKKAQTVQIPYRPILFGVFLIFLVISLFNLFFYVRIHKEKRGLEQQWKSLEGPYNEALALDQELGSSVLSEIDFYGTFVDPPLETAQAMNLVSDFIPKSAWLSSLKIERKGKELQLLMIGFSDGSEPGSRLVEIQNFANKVKDEMERVLGEGASPGAAKPVLTSAVATANKAEDSTASSVTEFTAVIQTEGFGAVE